MRIFLDANILFSAAKSEAAIKALLERLLEQGHELCADGYVVEEARRNLAAKAPARLAALDVLLRRLHVAGAQSVGRAPDILAPLPEKDRPVLAAAIHHRCAVLVTGDRAHFGILYGKSVQGVTIHSPRSLAEALLR